MISFCMGLMYIVDVPERSARTLGDDCARSENFSKMRLLDLHRRNSYPPASFSGGNESRRMSRSSAIVQSMLGMVIFFLPRPARSRASFSCSVVGTEDCLHCPRHRNLRVHEDMRFFLSGTVHALDLFLLKITRSSFATALSQDVLFIVRRAFATLASSLSARLVRPSPAERNANWQLAS